VAARAVDSQAAAAKVVARREGGAVAVARAAVPMEVAVRALAASGLVAVATWADSLEVAAKEVAETVA